MFELDSGQFRPPEASREPDQDQGPVPGCRQGTALHAIHYPPDQPKSDRGLAFLLYPRGFCGCRRTGQCPERPLNFGEQRLFDAADRALFNAKRQGRNRLACAEIEHAAIVIAESGPRIGLNSPNHPGGKVPSDGGEH